MTDTTNTGSGKLALHNAVYDVAKNTTQVYLPAASTLYITLAAIFGWPGAQEVSQTVIAVVLFLGIVLKISTSSYNNSDKSNDGELQIDQSDPLKDSYNLNVSTPLDQVAQADKITLKVNNVTPQTSSTGSMDPRLITPPQ